MANFKGLVKRATTVSRYAKGLPSLRELSNSLDIARRQRAYAKWEARPRNRARSAFARRMGASPRSGKKQGGGSGSRSDAARKAWVTRRGG